MAIPAALAAAGRIALRTGARKAVLNTGRKKNELGDTPALVIEVKGVERTVEILKAKDITTQEVTNAAIHEAGFFLQKEVKESIAGRRPELASVDTGRFLGSVETDNSRKFVTRVFSDVSYAKFLEFGTTSIAPRSHFRNSASRNRRKIVNGIQDRIRRKVGDKGTAGRVST